MHISGSNVQRWVLLQSVLQCISFMLWAMKNKGSIIVTICSSKNYLSWSYNWVIRMKGKLISLGHMLEHKCKLSTQLSRRRPKSYSQSNISQTLFRRWGTPVFKPCKTNIRLFVVRLLWRHEKNSQVLQITNARISTYYCFRNGFYNTDLQCFFD